jgi:hypothetical protein
VGGETETTETEATGGKKRGKKKGRRRRNDDRRADIRSSIWKRRRRRRDVLPWEGQTREGRRSGMRPGGGARALALHQTIRPGEKSPVERARFLPDGTRSIGGPGDGFVEIWGGDKIARQSPSANGDGANDRSSSSDASASLITIACADGMDSETLRTSDLPHRRHDDPAMFTRRCSPWTYRATGRCSARCRRTGPCAFGRYWTRSYRENWGGHAEGSSDPQATATGVRVWGSAARWYCSVSLQTHTCARFCNTTNRSCGDFASDSCPMGSRYWRGDMIRRAESSDRSPRER